MRLFAVSLALAATLSACSSTPERQQETVYDPFENFNRKVYGFNDGVDRIFIGPVARAYNNNVPEPARDGVHNLLVNSNSTVVFANDVLQAKPDRAAQTLARFIINSTLGLGGLFDVAGRSGLEGHTEDFGQTLGYWGFPSGAYFVSPFLGPSNIRDTTGRIVDTLFDPLTWVEFGVSDNLDTFIQIGRTGVTAIDTRARFDAGLESLRAQPEPYIALRRAYTTQRRSDIRDGKIDTDAFDDLPDFDEFEEFDELEDDFETSSSAGTEE